MSELIDYGIGCQDECSPLKRINGCANNVPFILTLDTNSATLGLSYTNLQTGITSSTPPAGFQIGTCAQCNGVGTEITGFDACYNGVPAFIQIVSNEAGVFMHYTASLKNGTGTIINPATATLITSCPTIDYQIIEVCESVQNSFSWTQGLVQSGQTLTFNITQTSPSDTLSRVYVDFGNGYIESAQGLTAAISYTYPPLADGTYQLKAYSLYLSGVQRLVFQRDITFSGGILQTVSPVIASGSSSYLYPKKIQAVYDSAALFIRYQNVNGSAYTPIGSVSQDCVSVPYDAITQSDEASLFTQIVLQENAGIERWIRLDDSTPTQAITTSQINDKLYDSLSISNLTPYADLGDFRPFRGQDPQNTTVVWVEVIFFDPTSGGNYGAWYSIPSGSKLIQMEGKSIVEVTRIAIQDKTDGDLSANANNIEVKAFSNGSAPTTPINLLFTFNLSV